MPICILFAAFLVLGNLSLTFNPVSFFQLAKILTVPTVVLFNFVLLRKTTPTAKCVAVGVACIGVGESCRSSGGSNSSRDRQLIVIIAMATGSSASSNLVGTAFAVASFCSTALYQITIGKMLSTPLDGEEVTAPQLLMNQTLLSSGLLVVLIPFFDTMPDWGGSLCRLGIADIVRKSRHADSVYTGTVPTQAIVTMLASGFVAAIINLTQFLIIGSTSVLAFNVVGIMKTVVTLLLAWWTEGKVVGARDAVGVLLAIGGSFAYAQIKT